MIESKSVFSKWLGFAVILCFAMAMLVIGGLVGYVKGLQDMGVLNLVPSSIEQRPPIVVPYNPPTKMRSLLKSKKLPEAAC